LTTTDAATSYQCAVTVTGSAICGRQVPAKLRVGKRAEAFRSRELTDDEKVSVLRAYLMPWKVEVSAFFDGIGPDSSVEALRAFADDHSVFEDLATSLNT